ncbi:hypothetical protein [Lysinibacillus piscis]|uniref:Uncharacterized protein n=1 Tax=Lysinibacillus piscis TaxID=2518931 RepID=A0ABQ5NF49_9BACI|nr:hypothetical protein [Lysinibacillus sp. KH24]GLC87010.1 hypothetical protein LYSBPC_01370 [Lysinibacillus sp. KH24]
MQSTRNLTQSEIEALLDGPQKCFQRINGRKVKVTEEHKANLRKSLEKTIETFKAKIDFKNAKQLSDLLLNFDNVNFFVEFADNDSIFYSFECIKESQHYTFTDSGFFTLPKK